MIDYDKIYDNNQIVKITVRTYIKDGFNDTYLSDANENCEISLSDYKFIKHNDYINKIYKNW